MNSIAGCWRAIVVANNDPERRGRVRVRVEQLYPPTVPNDTCPWAELGTFGGASNINSQTKYQDNPFGDLPNYQVGDLVWVVFEGGDPRFPVVFAGWFSDVSFPADLRSSYADSRKRWRRQSRTGAIIEFDERPDSFRINFQAGPVQVELHQTNNTILIKTTGGTVNVQSPQINAQCDDIHVQTQTAEIVASGNASVQSSQQLTLHGATVTIQADAVLNLNAPIVTVNAPLMNFNGLAVFSQNPIEPGE